MPNAMADASKSECGGELESQRNLTVAGIRSCDECGDFETKGEERAAGLCAEEDDDGGRRRSEIVAGSYVSKGYDYIGFPDVASSSHSQSVRKPYDRVLGKLGPKTIETELRLGLPEEAQNNDGLDVTGSKRGPFAKTSDVSIARSTYPEGFRDSTIFQQQQILGCEQSRFSKGYSFQNPEELKQKHTLHEIATRELPFDIRLSQHEKWAKPMMVMPPLNPSFRMPDISDNRRTFSSGAKRVFSETQSLDSPKLVNPQSRLPPPTFMFPFPNTWQTKWESPQSEPSLGKFSGHMGANNTMPTLTPVLRNDCAEEASSTASHAPHQVARELPPENKSTSAEIQAARNENGGPSEPRAAPVVGWPPIRSFRRNMAPQPKLAAPVPAPPPPPPPAAVPVTDPAGQKKTSTLFVKVNVEGVPIGRKIDLKAYDSYKNLSLALDEMFRGSIPAQNTVANPSSENNEPSLLGGGDYVLVYEDDEGDRMLVGDVPWKMFVSTVKRLRVLKSSDVRGL
ncbi:hypothetical protein KI387_012658, partial [Taxus chinensis]